MYRSFEDNTELSGQVSQIWSIIASAAQCTVHYLVIGSILYPHLTIA